MANPTPAPQSKADTPTVDEHQVAGGQWHEILPGVEIKLDRDAGHVTTLSVRHGGQGK